MNQTFIHDSAASGLLIDRAGSAHIHNFLNACYKINGVGEQNLKMQNIFSLSNLEILMNMQCHVYAKDKKGIYIFCNDSLAKDAGFAQSGEIIGRKDNSLLWQEYSNIFCGNDRKVLITGDTNFCYEPTIFKDDVRRVTFSCKIPLYSANEKIFGILGFSIASGIHELASKTISKNDSLNFKEISLREYTCLYHLVYGKSAKQIAQVLHISHRTVEEHFQNLRKKLKCNNRTQLIEMAINSGILKMKISS